MKISWLRLSILIFQLVFIPSAFSAEKDTDSTTLSPDDFKEFWGKIETNPTLSSKPTSCQTCDTTPAKLINCSQAVDNVCKKILDEKTKSIVTFGESIFMLGKSTKSGLSLTKLTDLQALVKAENQLPSDLKKNTQHAISKIKALLEKENDSDEWIDALNDAEMAFYNAVEETAKERTFSRNPEIKKTKKADRSYAQSIELKRDVLDIKNEVVSAKYETHPNWRRVVRVFEQTKQYLVTEISSWKIKSEEKQQFINQIQSVKLSLPTNDPRTLSSNPVFANCPTTLSNAYYNGTHNTFTVCAGRFNSTLSDASLFHTIAHELGHSIDPDAQATARFYNSPIGDVLDKLCNSTGPAYSCADWNALKGGPLSEPVVIEEPKPSIRKLTSCLKSEKELEPFDSATLKRAAAERTAIFMDSRASENDIFDLAKPPKEGETRPYFLRPDQIATYHSDSVEIRGKCYPGNDQIPSIFTQELSCLSYTGRETDRTTKIEQALKASATVQTRLFERWYEHCGRECGDLKYKNMSRPTHEPVADWISNRALTRLLETEPSLEKRREIVSAAFSDDCQENQVTDIDIRRTERSWNLAPHDITRNRTLAIYSAGVAPLVECSIDEETKKVASKCEY